VGWTPLLHSRRLDNLLPGSGRLLLKWEGNNPTHTHKDRVALGHVKRAFSQGYDTITVGTCGNLGVSIAFWAREYGLKAVVFVPRRYVNTRLSEMKSLGASITLVDGTYEDAVRASVRAARRRGWYNANPGGENDDVALESYASIAFEIVEQLGTAPDVVAVPVGNGTTLAGIYAGFSRLIRYNGYGMPVMVGGTTVGGNQVLVSWLKGGRPVRLGRESIVETKVNEPLVSYRSFNCREALQAVRETGGAVYGFTDEELSHCAGLVSKLEGVNPLPASASAILAAIRYSQERGLPGTYVAVITGGEPVWSTP